MLFLRFLWNSYTRAFALWLLHWFYPVKRGRVMLVSWAGSKYNCNPRAIAEAIIGNDDISQRFELNYAFTHPESFTEVPITIHKVEIGSLEYYQLLATSKFIITNIRLAGQMFPFKKRGQYYIHTTHGGHGLKKVEKDAADVLPEAYIRQMKLEAGMIDLMLSDSRIRTKQLHESYLYPGEILEKGLPRNKVFFQSENKLTELRKKVCDSLALPDNAHLLLYAPTFRNNGRRDVYGFDVNRVLAACNRRWGGEWFLLISSHPNMLSFYREIYDFSHPKVRDIGGYDLQNFLVVGEALITDYSSSGLDFSLIPRPVFLLAYDLTDYDRGFYFDIRKLPYPLSQTEEELIHNIESFNERDYRQSLKRFQNEVIGLNETGHASEAVVQWMLKHIDNP